MSVIQWNLSIATTLGEEHYGRYTGVAALQGFGYYGSIIMHVANFIPDQNAQLVTWLALVTSV